MKRKTNSQTGFTIIEVILVLALAGLIFLMVFIALPQLQRSQRDAARKDDMMLFVEAVKKYQGNNRGTLPTTSGSGPIDRHCPASSSTSWAGFYCEYLDAEFGDPRDDVYHIVPQDCGSSVPRGQHCNYADPDYDNNIYVLIQGTCEEDHAVKAANPRDFAVIYHTESSGIYCFGSTS